MDEAAEWKMWPESWAAFEQGIAVSNAAKKRVALHGVAMRPSGEMETLVSPSR